MHADRRVGLLIVVVLIAAGASIGMGSARSKPHVASSPNGVVHVSRVNRVVPMAVSRPPVPRLVVSTPAHTTAGWTPVAKVHAQPAA